MPLCTPTDGKWLAAGPDCSPTWWSVLPTTSSYRTSLKQLYTIWQLTFNKNTHINFTIFCNAHDLSILTTLINITEKLAKHSEYEKSPQTAFKGFICDLVTGNSALYPDSGLAYKYSYGLMLWTGCHCLLSFNIFCGACFSMFLYMSPSVTTMWHIYISPSACEVSVFKPTWHSSVTAGHCWRPPFC